MNLTDLRTLMAADAAKQDYELIIEDNGTGGITIHHQDEVGTTTYEVPHYEGFIDQVNQEKVNHESFEDAFWDTLASYYCA